MDLLEFDKKKCLEKFNSDEDRFKKDIEFIQEWMKSQHHLPPMDEDRIRGILLRCKLSLEKTKKRIDSYFTIKSSFPELIKKMDPILPFVGESVTCVPLKKLTSNQERILCIKYHPKDDFDVFETLITTAIFQELLMKYDYCWGSYAVIDLANCTWEFFKKFTPVYLKTAHFFTKKAFGTKTTGIFLINTPPLIEKVLAVVKPFTEKKIYDRITVCPDLEFLHSFIDKNLLPKEYGGDNNETLQEMKDNWSKILLEHRPYFLEIMQEQVDESKRIEKLDFTMEELHGSFRQLEFD